VVQESATRIIDRLTAYVAENRGELKLWLLEGVDRGVVLVQEFTSVLEKNADILAGGVTVIRLGAGALHRRPGAPGHLAVQPALLVGPGVGLGVRRPQPRDQAAVADLGGRLGQVLELVERLALSSQSLELAVAQLQVLPSLNAATLTSSTAAQQHAPLNVLAAETWMMRVQQSACSSAGTCLLTVYESGRVARRAAWTDLPLRLVKYAATRKGCRRLLETTRLGGTSPRSRTPTGSKA
jgi:hypothetical protein